MADAIQQQYELIDQTLDALDAGLYDTREESRPVLKRWIVEVRNAGFPTLAYELEQIDYAIDRGDVRQVGESLTKAGHLTSEAAQHTDGMLKKQLQQLGEQLAASGQEIKESLET